MPEPARAAPVQPAWAAGGGALAPEGPHGGGDLAALSERAGFVPRPDVYDERLKPGFRGGRALFLFFLINAVPIGAALYYLREQRASRSQLSLGALPRDAEDVAAEVLRVIKTAAVCFLVQDESSAGAGNGGVLRVDPHTPEGTAFIPATEPLPLMPQMERNDLTDIFESPPVAGLGFIHFAVSRASPFGQAMLEGHRRANLLYMSNTRGAYCNVAGQVSILSDPDARRRYWKGIWSASFPVQMSETARPRQPAAAPAVVAASFLGTAPPSAAAAAAAAEAAAAELPPMWQNPDYLLIRLAVSEATLRSTSDGPQRWDSRRVVRRSDMDGPAEGGSKWKLAAPAAA